MLNGCRLNIRDWWMVCYVSGLMIVYLLNMVLIGVRVEGGLRCPRNRHVPHKPW